MKKRIDLIDSARGISIIAMIVHHTLYDFETLFNVSIPFIYSSFFNVLWIFFVAVFMIVSGISSNFSRNNIKRGLIVLAAGVLVTIASVIFSPDYPIYFGILQFFGTCMIIYGLLKNKIDKINQKILFYCSFGLFIVLYFIVDMPIRINFPYLFILGFPSYSFAAGDYFPLLPYFFLFLAGTALGKPIVQKKFPKWFYEIKIPYLSPVGKYSLYVYLLHQPVLYLILIPIKAVLF